MVIDHVALLIRVRAPGANTTEERKNDPRAIAPGAMVDLSGQRISTPGLPGVVVRMAGLLTWPNVRPPHIGDQGICGGHDGVSSYKRLDHLGRGGRTEDAAESRRAGGAGLGCRAWLPR
jgi:hypothetical protein